MEEQLTRLEAKIDAIAEGQAMLREEFKEEIRILDGNLRQEIQTGDQALRESLRQEIHAVHVLYEDTRSDIRAVAEAVVTLGGRMDRGFIEQRELYERRVEPIESVVRQSSATLTDHEQRLTRLEQRRKR